MNFFGLAVIAALLWADTTFASKESAEPIKENGLTWEECVDLAVENNPDFTQAQLQVEEVEGLALSKRAVFLPSLKANAVSLPPTFVFGFSQVLYSKAREPSFRAFRLAKEGARVNVQLALLELVYKLRESFDNALYAQKLVAIRQREVALIEDRLRRAPSLFEAGLLKKSDQTALEVRTSLVRESLNQAILQEEVRRLELAQLIGLSVKDKKIDKKLAGDFKSAFPQETDLRRLRDMALANRLDLKLLNTAKLGDEALILIAGASAYPSLGMGATFIRTYERPAFLNPITKLMDPQSAEKDDDDNDITESRASVIGQVNWRIFDAGMTAGAVQVARTQKVKREVMIEQLRREIPHQVELALTLATSAKKLLEKFAEQSVGENSIKLARSAYEAGQASQIEVLQAQEDAIAYEKASLDLQYQLDLALAALDRVMGNSVRVE